MNKTLKITLISLASILGFVLIVLLLACWLILTPARLTNMVRNQAPNFISCDFYIEQADITLFKSFPNIGLEIDDVTLVNPMKDSPSDTLAYVNKCVISVNIKEFLKENNIIINECRLNEGYINLFTDNQGATNLDIFPPSEPDTIPNESEFTYGIDLSLLKMNDVSVNYTDLTNGMCASLDDITLMAKGNMKADNLAGELSLSLKKMFYSQTTDSLSMAVRLDEFKVEGDGEMIGDDVKAKLKLSSSTLSYESAEQLAVMNSVNVAYAGDINNNFDHIDGSVTLSLDDMSFSLGNELLLNKADINVKLPLNATLSTMDIELGESQLALNNIVVDLIGNTMISENEDVVVDLRINTNTLIVEEIIDLIPESMKEDLLDGMDVGGELKLAANVKGLYNANSIPAVNAEIQYENGTFSMPEMLPYPLTNMNTSLDVDLNLNDKSDINVKYLKANMSNSNIYLSGTVKDVMDKMYCNINLKANADIDELQDFIPEGIDAHGKVTLKLAAAVDNEQITSMNLMDSKINAELQWKDMNLVYFDTISAVADHIDVKLSLPNTSSEELTNSLAALNISGTSLDARVSDMIVAALKDYKIDAQISNVLSETEAVSVYADYDLSRLDFNMDDINLFINNPSGSLAMFAENDSDDASYIAVYSGDSLSFMMGEEMSFATESLDFNVSADYDDDQEDILLKWNPHAGVRLSQAVFSMSDIEMPIYIPSIDFQYDTTGVVINNSSILMGNSDFALKGKLTSVDEFIRKEDLLRGNLDFTSHYTDVNQLMELFSGMGDTTVMAEEMPVTDTIQKADDPFMVPLGLDITLNTKIDKALAGNMRLNNVGGGLTVKNGVLVLQEMGFTSDAATMKVTAMYKSPRKNHLYLGLNLHLLEIDIAEMIDLIPELDTLVPMLKSFAGKAEFHFAAETYLKSNYELKISTLRGATAIHGKDLVVLDNETYRRIGRLLAFKDKKHNVIDSLNVEITAFKNEIDVYPTLIAVDKYEALIQGRHNLNMTFDYRMGMSNPRLINWLGIWIKGDEDDMKFKVKLKKNLDLDEPRGSAEDVYLMEEIKRLKNLIYNSLKD